MFFLDMIIKGDLRGVFVLATIILASEFFLKPDSSFRVFSFVFFHDDLPELVDFFFLIMRFAF